MPVGVFPHSWIARLATYLCLLLSLAQLLYTGGALLRCSGHDIGKSRPLVERTALIRKEYGMSNPNWPGSPEPPGEGQAPQQPSSPPGWQPQVPAEQPSGPPPNASYGQPPTSPYTPAPAMPGSYPPPATSDPFAPPAATPNPHATPAKPDP